ncbi:MAG: hypothetical protein ABIE74_00595 [Pseudomonadota bacterium]
MPLLLDFDMMESLWEDIPKTSDGKQIIYKLNEVNALWLMGFVDTKHISIDEWVKIFDQWKAPDGNYLLDHGAFMTLEQYRYKGEIKVPFDAMKINEGKYTDEGFQDLVDSSIVPSTSLGDADLKKFFDELKKRYRKEDGLLEIKKEAKALIARLIEKYPSPLHNLELLFDKLLVQGLDKDLEDITKLGASVVATTEAMRQASHFSAEPTKEKETLKDLKKLEKTESPKETVKTDKTVELKKIRRSYRGMRG